MPALRLANIIRLLVAGIWLTNGIYCKLLMQVPRHRDIVARILGADHADVITRLIGLSEVFMAIWVLSRIRAGLCAVSQVVIIIAMNLLEFTLARDLLLFGPVNLVLACVLCASIVFGYLLERRTPAKV
ncbi:MAG: hypothetical protein KF744_14790 [Taibaiella sp.]|nr:hypothetical protein [Taibaiella sp.]